MKNIADILKSAREKLKLSQQEVADLVGISQKTYSMYENNERSPKYSTAVKLQNVLMVPELVAIIFPSEAKQVSHDAFMEVPYIPAQAQAGYASGFADSQEYDLKQLPTMLVSKEYEKGNYLVVEAIGDSMDDGTSRTIGNGDKILVKELDRGAWVFKLNFKKYLFVIVTKDGVVFKQIIDHNLETKTITCHSFNPIIQDFDLSLENDVMQLFYVKKIVEKQIIL